MSGVVLLRSAAIGLLLSVSCWSQAVPVGTDLQRQERERLRNEAELQRRMGDLHTVEQRIKLATDRDKIPASEPRLTDEQRERVQRLRKVDLAEVKDHAALLAQPKTGVFKLFPDAGCMSKNVISIAGDCARFVPLSSSFDFRKGGYGDDIYHDIHFANGRLASESFFSQGIITSLGAAPIESVGLDDTAVRYLADFAADTEPKAAARHAKEFQAGVESGGFRYASWVEPQPNTTYAMRMIAYRLDNGLRPLAPDLTMNEMMFHSLTFDKRVDVIVAFRVLGTDENGGLTVVWKELKRSDAAKIKFPKGERLKDFRPEKRTAK